MRHGGKRTILLFTTSFLLRRGAAFSFTRGFQDRTVAGFASISSDRNRKTMSAPSSDATVAEIVPTTAESLRKCGERLRRGRLVAFPTETVYGLGCHAMDEDAIHGVFAAKERPLTDPLIVHVASKEDAFPLWEARNSKQSLLFRALDALCDRFWPGPLTVVAEAAESVPDALMASTGYVACRSPSHPIARSLLQVAAVPIAAPSANKFGHVSPTTAGHVWDDLKNEDVWIVESDETSPSCDIGVESTVIKVEESSAGDKLDVTMLRQGAVSTLDIMKCMESIGAEHSVRVHSKTNKMESDDTATVAPGQSIRHYSPDVPSFILAKSRCRQLDALSEDEKERLAKSVIVDFGGALVPWKPFALDYRDLDPSGDSAGGAKTVFGTLRWAERVAGAERILFPQLDGGEDALLAALQDRLTRAASGNVVDQIP